MSGLAAALRDLAPVFREIGQEIRLRADGSDPDYCPSLFFPASLFEGKVIEGMECVVGIRRKAERGELLRIDFDIDALGVAGLKQVLVLLTRLEIGPALEGFGEIVVRETAEGAVIARVDDREVSSSHVVTPQMIEAGVTEISGFDLQDAWESPAALRELISRVYLAMLLSPVKEEQAPFALRL